MLLSSPVKSFISGSSKFLRAMAGRQFSNLGDSEEILVEKTPNARLAILNRPKKLNSLTHNMVVRLLELYQEWEADKSVAAIIVKGNGRAFCAGGDVARVVELGKQGKYREASDFFCKEYVLNYYLATLQKPHVALLNGVVMGGGNGISMHGMYRVATEKTLFAMPETALGLHPDVGASYFLSHLTGHVGEYLGLTGERLDGADMLSCGLATHYVQFENLSLLENELRGVSSSSDVEKIIAKFSETPSLRPESSMNRMEDINKCFSKETVEEILGSVEEEKEDEWYQQTASKLRKASPVSLKISLASIRNGRHQSLAECLIREYRMSVRSITAKLSPDFYEGCRSILIEKDNRPQWRPGKLEEVSSEMVNGYLSEFSKEEEVGEEELELPSSRIRARY